jgi:hypothetical protein
MESIVSKFWKPHCSHLDEKSCELSGSTQHLRGVYSLKSGSPGSFAGVD